MYNKLIKKEAKISLIGLGYVGLPIALEFAKQVSVIGFDIKPGRIELMKKGIDPSNELTAEAFKNSDITFTSDVADLKDASFHIIAVPTPTNRNNLPDLSSILKASEAVGKVLKNGDYVVYESTVYPGCTEDDCIPVLVMGITFKEDVTDIRNSKVVDVISELNDFKINVDIIDPGAGKEEVKEEYDIELKDQPTGKYDAVILAVNHSEYLNLDESFFNKILTKEGIVVDVKGVLRGKINNHTYWSL